MIQDLLEADLLEEKMAHIPVLLDDVLKYLKPEAGKIYVDATFGAGGYSKAILTHTDCKIIAIDQDPDVIIHAHTLEQEFGNRFTFLQGNFEHLPLLLSQAGYSKVDGVVFDLGVSSMQLDNGMRGFSFMQDAPLDMRMNNKEGITAADLVNSASEEELANIIYQYGEERDSRKIARKIIEERAKEPITNTARLAWIVRSAIGLRKSKIDLATKTFQALRICVNDELGALTRIIENIHTVINPGGRVVFVSFHSLEDSIVKHYLKENSVKKVTRSKYAKTDIDNSGCIYNLITRKAIKPLMEEVIDNSRARSARLRAAELI
jgi:16S rRNA (cytosine1402-N4)-methyltransferase